MTSVLEQLRKMTKIVADTGDLAAVKRLKPVDCTTNPSLVLAALKDASTEPLIERELAACHSKGKNAREAAATLTVAIGVELAQFVPGRVSTEVDACLSFDTAATVRRAHEIIEDYAARGIEKDRVLIKIAATWEGIRAAEILQRDGIDCNLTLLFSMAQAVACADAGAFLISPFVGRITDWHKKAKGVDRFPPDSDPGVVSVRQIFDYYKSNGIQTVVMGASFRNTGQIKALAGCDNLTISPKLIDELAQEEAMLSPALTIGAAEQKPALHFDESSFRWALNADAMATEKLAEGIRSFDADHQLLVALLANRKNKNAS